MIRPAAWLHSSRDGQLPRAFGPPMRSRGCTRFPISTRNLRTGPAIGSRIPAFEAVDQTGKRQTFETLKGPKGVALLLSARPTGDRSARLSSSSSDNSRRPTGRIGWASRRSPTTARRCCGISRNEKVCIIRCSPIRNRNYSPLRYFERQPSERQSVLRCAVSRHVPYRRARLW